MFWALALNETFDHKSMDPLLKAIKILEPIDRKYPDHPGVTHYLIHSYDFPPIAKRGVAAANKYPKIAPSAPHAQHMPSHIYSMVGMWEESVMSNWRSVVIATDYAAKAKLDGTLGGVPHAYDFMAYAYLQLGQDIKARALIQDAASIKKSALGPTNARWSERHRSRACEVARTALSARVKPARTPRSRARTPRARVLCPPHPDPLLRIEERETERNQR